MRKRSFPAYLVNTGGKNWAFVPHPSFRGSYIRTDRSVLFNACPWCKAPMGVPCKFAEGYSVQVHHHRKDGMYGKPMAGGTPTKRGVAVEADLGAFASRVSDSI